MAENQGFELYSNPQPGFDPLAVTRSLSEEIELNVESSLTHRVTKNHEPSLILRVRKKIKGREQKGPKAL